MVDGFDGWMRKTSAVVPFDLGVEETSRQIWQHKACSITKTQIPQQEMKNTKKKNKNYSVLLSRSKALGQKGSFTNHWLSTH